jgi:phosphoglycerate kinase
MKSIRDVDMSGSRVLMRCDFNVPLDETGRVLDDFRIQETLPTIEYILKKKGKLVLMTHIGDPEGKVVQRLRVDGIQKKLAELLDVPVVKAPDCVGKKAEALSFTMAPGDILLLENLRFHKEEQENSRSFAKQLASLGDMYVNDAFSVCHRAHASTIGVPALLPSFAGLFLEHELAGLERLLKNPKRPVVAIIGGKKIDSKLPVIDAISETADAVLLGNLLASEAKRKKIRFQNPSKILFPLDGIFDIGPKTKEVFLRKIKEAKTVFWAGPLGKYEETPYQEGSLAVAKAIVQSNAFSVAGGGNLIAFLGKYRLREKFSHLSTGGSAMLAFLAGKILPGLQALDYYDGN